MFLRLSLVRLCLLSDRMFLYILKDLSTSKLAVWQNLNLATSSKAMALWERATSAREHSGNCLDVAKSRVLLHDLVQLGLELLAHLTRDIGQLVLCLLNQL